MEATPRAGISLLQGCSTLLPLPASTQLSCRILSTTPSPSFLCMGKVGWGGGWAKNLIPKPEKGREGGREGSRESFAGKSPLHPAPLSSLREKKGRGARILIPKPAKVQTKKKGGGVGGSQRGKGEAFAAKSDKWD